MKQDKWTQQLHDALKEHQTAAPEGLWSDIEAALQAQPSALHTPSSTFNPPPSTKRARFVTLRRWMAAASVAALLSGGGYWWLSSDPKTTAETAPQQPVGTEQPTETAQQQPVHDELPAPQAVRQQPVSTVSAAQKPAHQQLASAEQPEKPVQQQPNTTEQQPNTTELPGTTAQQQPDHAETTAQDPSTLNPPPSTFHPQTSNLKPQISNIKSQTSTLSLYVSNGFGEQTGGNGVLMADALAQNYTQTYEAGNQRHAPKRNIYLTGYEERQHHYLPLAVGLSLSYQLTPRLSVATGLTYTRMKSDFLQLMNTQEIRQKQTLHYLGIPLSLSYQLYSQGNFRAYLTAGGEADWNIKTHLETEGVEQPLQHDRTQWSVRGSLGVEYYIIPQLGLYAEPGVSYYFDNGSHMQNYWKDKPTNVNLQFGVRLNLTK